MHKRLVIVAGAAGEIGSLYVQRLASREVHVVAVVRHKRLSFSSPFVTEVFCHLDDESQIQSVFKSVPVEDYQAIIYLHTIGVDKFEPRGYPNIRPLETINPEVYKTNVNSFKYLMRYLVKRVCSYNQSAQKNIQLKLCMIGGVPDKYAPFVIEDFCEAKYIIRQYIQFQVNLYPESVSGLSINITSTLTQPALAVRPHADTQYWLLPEEVVEGSLDVLLVRERGYREIDLIKKSPMFIQGYYEDNALLYAKWSRETGVK